MALAYPDGHRGLAGQKGFVYGADGVTLLDAARTCRPRWRSGARRSATT